MGHSVTRVLESVEFSHFEPGINRQNQPNQNSHYIYLHSRLQCNQLTIQCKGGYMKIKCNDLEIIVSHTIAEVKSEHKEPN